MSERHWSHGLVPDDEPVLTGASWHVYRWYAAMVEIAAWVSRDEQEQRFRMPELVDVITQQLHDGNPLAGQHTIYADLLDWAIQSVDSIAVAATLYGEGDADGA